MKSKNALGKAAIILALVFVTVHSIARIMEAFSVIKNAIYCFAHSNIPTGILLFVREGLNLFLVAILFLCLYYVQKNKKDFTLIINLNIIFYALSIIQTILVFIMLDEGNTLWGVIKDNYTTAIILAAWIVLACGKDKMPNKVIFATTRIGLAVAGVSDSAYFILRDYFGSAYDETRMDRLFETANNLGYLIIWVIIIVIFVVFICWPKVFEKSEDDSHPSLSSSEQKQQ